MSDSPQTKVMVDEAVPLNNISGSGDTPNSNAISGRGSATCGHDKYHRKLAISSIICGITCIGVIALTNSFKAEHTTDPTLAATFSRRARKYSIISIVVLVSILVSIPILMALITYVLTLQD